MTSKKIPFQAIFCLFIFFISCRNTEPNTAIEQTQLPEQPNILWLVAEDLSPYLAAFGDSTAHTPTLDKLASEGVVYTHVYSPSGVCAPSRAAIATGLYPSGFGANHMRTNSYTKETGLPAYEAVPPAEVEMISQILRKNGYYCSNNSKEDYQFKPPVTAWDESSSYAHWRNRNEGQPFFSIFNFNVTHESRLFEPYRMRKSDWRHYQAGDTSFNVKGFLDAADVPVHLAKESNFPIPPYLPKTTVVKNDLWKMYNNISEMDRQVGAILNQLEQDGLLEETVIFFFADHGGPLPRQKRLLYDAGLKVPMIIRFPKQLKAGERDGQLVSFVDFAPTLMSLAGLTPKPYMQGQAFLGDYTEKNTRNYIHAAADRFDAFTDNIRAVRSHRFKYLRNYRPEQGYYLPVSYRERIPTMQELLRLGEKDSLDALQAQWFRAGKPKEELFDCIRDPHELYNLADSAIYAEILAELSDEMDRWLNEIGDDPLLPERELIQRLWNDKGNQPVTTSPHFEETDQGVAIRSETPGASIAYQIINENGISSGNWEIYRQPVSLEAGETLVASAHRIGFQPSDKIEY